MADLAYDLPASRIAREPAQPRGASKLLVALPELGAPRRDATQAVRKNLRRVASLQQSLSDLVDLTFADLVGILPPRAHLVFNESRVFAARMFATIQHHEQPVEVMFLEPERPTADPSAALALPCTGQLWRCMVRSAALSRGDELSIVSREIAAPVDRLRIVEVHSLWREEGEEDGTECSVTFHMSDPAMIAQRAFDNLGHIPLPPYMERSAAPADEESYQTVYANPHASGSVAAPTAGLHFTPKCLQQLDAVGMARSSVVLHVGAGTFRPVVSADIGGHAMHEERFSVSTEVLDDLAASVEAGRPIIPVGTTSSRCLESLYWLGVKALRASSATVSPPQDYRLGQWEAYALASSLASNGNAATAQEALHALAFAARSSGRSVVSGVSSLCIAPGYHFRLCDALVTNFHMPDSTLMALVGALAGGTKQLQRIYAHALAQDYRFLSYGDACLVFNAQPPLPTHTGSQAVEFSTSSPGGSLAHAVQQMRRGGGDGMRVLLHSCCAPCSGAMVEEMQAQGLDVTIFFYNPNIHPRKEYDIRKEENKRYAEKLGIPFVDADYDVDEWYRRAQGMEFAPERGARCTMCFDMRFERSALYAKEHGFTHFTTTNATSRWKDQAQVNGSGMRVAERYPGIEYLVYDWQTEAMNDRKYRINAEEAFYKQEYCGCSYSLRDTNAHRRRENLEPVKIGGGGVYSDPVVDAEEESPELVANFFADTNSVESEAWRRQQQELYRERRKVRAGDGDTNNW